MARARRGARAGRAGRAPAPESTFLDMPCDLLTVLGPVASTPGYARDMDGLQRLCRTARDDAMLGAATADLRYPTPWGDERSRLRYACLKNDEARVQWLVDCGARDVSASYISGYKGGAALVRRLAPDPLVDATEALVAAAILGVAEVVAPLLARGAQLETQGASIGSLTAGTPLHAACHNGHAEVVKALLAARARVHARDANRNTPLMLAACNNHVDITEQLVEAGADVNAESFGQCAAQMAAEAEAYDAAQYLCSLPQANPHSHMLAAVMAGDEGSVRCFIAAGANVGEFLHEEEGEEPPHGPTAIELAYMEGHDGIVDALREAGAEMPPEDDADGGEDDYDMDEEEYLLHRDAGYWR
jgi:hypothetical protein